MNFKIKCYLAVAALGGLASWYFYDNSLAKELPRTYKRALVQYGDTNKDGKITNEEDQAFTQELVKYMLEKEGKYGPVSFSDAEKFVKGCTSEWDPLRALKMSKLIREIQNYKPSK